MDNVTAVSLGKPLPAPARSTTWIQAGPTSLQAHEVTKCGTNYFVTQCGVLIRRDGSVGATTATMRCFECQNRRKPMIASPLPDHSQGKGKGSKRPNKEPEPLTEKGRQLREAYERNRGKA
jgi:hypothetical protein